MIMSLAGSLMASYHGSIIHLENASKLDFISSILTPSETHNLTEIHPRIAIIRDIPLWGDPSCPSNRYTWNIHRFATSNIIYCHFVLRQQASSEARHCSCTHGCLLYLPTFDDTSKEGWGFCSYFCVSHQVLPSHFKRQNKLTIGVVLQLFKSSSWALLL